MIYWPVHGICSTGMEGAGGPLKNAVPALVCCTVIPFLIHLIHRKTCEAVKSWNSSLGFPFWPGTPPQDIAISWRLKWLVPVAVLVAAGSSGLVQTNLPWNAFREMLNKSCFQFSGNSWILVLRGSIEQAQVERNSLFQWADYGMSN